MAPTEEAILSSFLLPPSPLPSIITLKAFTELFPKAQQSSPQIRVLYRDLQHQRARVVDAVTHNISNESKRGRTQRRAVIRERRRAERGDQDDEVRIENALFGPSSNLDSFKPHSLSSILPDLESATIQLEEDVRRLEEEANAVLDGIHGMIGGLSDIRYGRLANTALPEQVIDDLTVLQSSCKN
ncbi:hypothetical protein GLAREA_10952 [Glarea lozoyensis ATCC 20868]|uniref:Cnl2/NKP2 family protein n=1 Tax=Glarea lozoyensis (strain ATCC 20868 / MF5171) TaxID=1116229 RepID=S3DC15_GLAL2|nr:uncharacterized protein GLAREA_10952 [Glarea lozoyensis ATCC 20868]EPE35255.1 hypothetical protein GLAREA_10952 [Glarea lozoyensis ATCC 20868]